MGWAAIAILAQLALLAYFELITLAPLYPWNDLAFYGRQEQTFEALLTGVPLALCLLVYVAGNGLLMLVGLVFYLVWFGAQLYTWWRPYLYGASQRERDLYGRLYSRTVRFLPPNGPNPVPDAQHAVLHLLALIAIATSALALLGA